MRDFTIAEMGEHVGQELGVSDWVTIDQSRIDAFASCTGDHQWIARRCGPRQARSPYRGPVAHGYLTLSMVAPLSMQIGILPKDAGRGFELWGRQGSFSCAGASGRARAVARRSCRLRAQGRREGDHEDPEHAGGRGIGKACPDRRNVGIPHSRAGRAKAMSAENRTEAPSTDSLSEQASRHTLALNPLVSLRAQDLLDSAGVLFKAMINEPRVAVAEWLSFLGEMSAIVGGKSDRAPQPGDKRFTDPTWTNSALHSSLLKAYLAWGAAVEHFVEQTSLSEADKQRASLFTTILVDALAPTNSLIANPAAMRKLLNSGGQSIWQGMKNYLEDLIKNGGLPSQVDRSAFKVGGNVATTPGFVVFRNEIIELIQYAPTTPKVWKRPLVITPPQINKYYVYGPCRRTRASCQVPS